MSVQASPSGRTALAIADEGDASDGCCPAILDALSGIAHLDDQSERTAGARALRERGEHVRAVREAQRLRTILDRSADIVSIISATGTIEYASPSYEHGLGYAPDGLRGRPALSLVHPDDVAAATAALERLATGSDVESLELRVRRADGGCRLFEVVARCLLHDPMVQGIVVTGRDITEKRQVEAQLRQAQKMEAVGQLAAGIAHDFNNLLTVIKAQTDFLAESVPEVGQQREDIDEIRKAVHRAAGLTRQLLTFSRRQPLEPRIVDPNEIVRELQKMLARLIGEDIDFTLRLSPDLGLVHADPGQIEQVLVNLAVNARDAMPRGGAIVIATRDVRVASDEAAGLGIAPGGYVEITVRDTGCGMTEEIRQRIFDPFFTTKPIGKGTGLGLATVYGIVRQSGGAVRVASEPGRGSTFTVLLPASSLGEIVATDVPAPGRHDGRETILLVEDDAAVRAVSRRILTGHGYEVVEARDGAEALAILEARPGRTHLVVTDAVMPQLNGQDLVARLTRDWPEMRVLLMSGYTDEDLTRRGHVPSGPRFLRKPFTSERLLRAVRAALDAPVTTRSA